MSVSILSRPTKSGCNWNALGNPVIFKLRRFDTGLNQINNNGGFIQIQFNGSDLTSFYQVGNSIYLISDNGVYELAGTITASAFSGGNTLVTINQAYISAAPGGVVINNSKRTDYRIEYNFKSIAGVELLGSDLAVSPTSSGLMLLNASLLKNLLSATWTLPVAVNEVDADGSIEFYVSYQEYYDGALQGSVTNDSANPIQGLLGANQIGSADGSNMLAYFPGSSSKKFLTRFQLNSALKGLKMWRDWPFTISIIHPDALTDLYFRTIQYGADNTLIESQRDLIDPAFDNEINRLLIPVADSETVLMTLSLVKLTAGAYSAVTIVNGTFTASITPWVNTGAGTDWTYNSDTVQVSLPAISNSKILLQTIPTPISGHVDGFIKMSIDILIPNTKQVDIQLYYNTSGGIPGLLGVLSNVIGNGSSSVQVVTGNIGVVSPITDLGFRIASDDTTAGNIIVTSVTFESTPANLQSETLSIEVDDACEYDEDNLPILGQNPIMLQWKNSLGGDAQWLFPFYHEASYNLKGHKAKRLILFDQDLSAVQWEAIQELISTNEVYSPPIIDLENTNTINYTSKQVGKQVYMIDQDGNKTGVIVIPNSDRINARDPHHRIAIEIELPEFQEA